MQQTAPDCHDGSGGALCSAVRLMRIRNFCLLLDTLVSVKHLERAGRKFSSSIMTNKLDCLAKLSLDLGDVALDDVLALRLGSQTEAIHTPASSLGGRAECTTLLLGRDLRLPVFL